MSTTRGPPGPFFVNRSTPNSADVLRRQIATDLRRQQHKVCIVENPPPFILPPQVMQKQADEQVAVAMVTETQKRFPGLNACNFDKGFHSPANQIALKAQLDRVALPRKGRLSKPAQEEEQADEFVKARRAHSAVESAINGLEVHGLDLSLIHI